MSVVRERIDNGGKLIGVELDKELSFYKLFLGYVKGFLVLFLGSTVGSYIACARYGRNCSLMEEAYFGVKVAILVAVVSALFLKHLRYIKVIGSRMEISYYFLFGLGQRKEVFEVSSIVVKEEVIYSGVRRISLQIGGRCFRLGDEHDKDWEQVRMFINKLRKLLREGG